MSFRIVRTNAGFVAAILAVSALSFAQSILAPGAMGTAQPASTNETAQGRAENRRVVVKAVVNRGVSES